MIELKDKLYTSTEVADIIGVSLRSVYRYLEEGKLIAEVKTATGRHRFTKKNILDFLYPDREQEIEEMVTEEVKVQEKQEEEKGEAEEIKEEPKVEQKEEEKEKEPAPAEVAADKEPEEEVDWLAKFREAAKKYKDDGEEETAAVEEEKAPEEDKEEAPKVYYYRSKLGGLKEIAQNIDKTAKNSDLEYAFTMHAGLSLFKPIKPFSTLHAYVQPRDRTFFERVLMLTPSEEDNAQLALITWPQNKLFKDKQELHGLSVVSNKRLLSDIAENDEELHKEALEILK